MKYKYILLAAIALGLFSCKPEINDGFTPSAGNSDFSTYVALGNSLTAGYADGALYHSAQEQSWTNLLASQLKEVGGGDFVQPVVTSEQGILPGKLKLAVVDGNLTPIPAEDGELEAFYPPLGYAVNNLGVPGAKVAHLLAPGYGNMENLAAGLANPYYIRFATTPNTAVIEQALAMNPSFFSLWIGNNDVLGYASSGGVGDVITPLADFTNYYGALAQSLASSGAKGVLANIPEVTSAAYFNTVPNNALKIDASTAAQMNLGLSYIEGEINSILSQAGLPEFSYNIEFKSGANLFLIEDNNFIYRDLLNAIADTTTDPLNKLLMKRVQFRQMTASELLTLTTPQDSLAMGMGSFMAVEGVAVPVPFGIPNQYVLDGAEMQLVATTIESYNAVIKNIADQYDWALVDINSIFDEVKDGIVVDGIDLNADFATGGVFSLDGIHLSPRGNAMVTNYFIEAINNKYNSAISTVNISDYNGVEFP